jgi:hypothetical protein
MISEGGQTHRPDASSLWQHARKSSRFTASCVEISSPITTPVRSTEKLERSAAMNESECGASFAIQLIALVSKAIVGSDMSSLDYATAGAWCPGSRPFFGR